MDLDAYSAAHREEWDRLAQLSSKRQITGAESDELIDRYQSGASQLSAIKSTVGTTAQGERLSLWLSRSRLRFTGTSANVLSQLPRFFGAQLPAAMYRIRWLTLAIALATVIPTLIFGWWASEHPAVLANFGDADFRKHIAEHDFVDYYSNYSGTSFTSEVWTHNAFLSAMCIALGIIGLAVPYLLLTNAQNIGYMGAIMGEYHHLDIFFLYIAPHGQLELYSVFMAGAAGMRIFWAWIAPGPRTRVAALAEEGRALFTIAVGVTITLFMSGMIEGFVTRQPWPWPIKIGIGTVALTIVLVYQWVIGGRAARAGETGDLEEFEAGARQLAAG
ncbi:MAG: stage II sporulation protein M [Salinibacterium sp.]|nr:MAG: stage II sporulation protein M [Salinibacterium sp.]